MGLGLGLGVGLGLPSPPECRSNMALAMSCVTLYTTLAWGLASAWRRLRSGLCRMREAPRDSPELDLDLPEEPSSISEISRADRTSPSSPSPEPERDLLECALSRLRTCRARSIFCIVTAAADSIAMPAAAPGQGLGSGLGLRVLGLGFNLPGRTDILARRAYGLLADLPHLRRQEILLAASKGAEQVLHGTFLVLLLAASRLEGGGRDRRCSRRGSHACE